MAFFRGLSAVELHMSKRISEPPIKRLSLVHTSANWSGHVSIQRQMAWRIILEKSSLPLRFMWRKYGLSSVL